MRWRGPAAIVNGRPNLSSERMLHKDYDRKGSVGEKLLVVSLNGACRQDETIGGK
jgi:hypothetical protein